MSLLDEFIDELNAAIQEAEYSPSEFAFDEQEADDPAWFRSVLREVLYNNH